MIEVLRNAGVHELAKDYVDLRRGMVSWYLDHVLKVDLQHAATPSEATPLPSSAYPEMERVHHLDAQYLQDLCLSASYPPSPFEFSGDM